MLGPIGVLLGTVLVGANADSAADIVSLRDGRMVLGQVVEPTPRGKVWIIVRRAWAEKALPDLARRWVTAEAPGIKQATDQRIARLTAWRRERPRIAGKNDPIGDWIDGELERLKGPNAPQEPARLMLVSLNRSDVRSLTKRPPATARLLRLGWRIDAPDVESQPAGELKRALEGRGFAPDGSDPGVVDDLLPLSSETEARWRLRRAATEVQNESNLRFIRYGSLVLPEDASAGGAAMNLGTLGEALKSLLGDEAPMDPLTARFAEVARTGRVGMLVTKLDIAPDTSSVRVETTLWIRLSNDRWEPAINRPATVRMDDARPDEAAVVGGDPQVKQILGFVESMGLGDLAPTLKNAGAATKRALGAARSELQKEIDSMALPVSAGP
jgi:hypothetical protein